MTSDDLTHHHTNHPGEHRPYGFDTTWCNGCDAPIHRDRQRVLEHIGDYCPGVFDYPCEFGFSPEYEPGMDDPEPPERNHEGDPAFNGAFNRW